MKTTIGTIMHGSVTILLCKFLEIPTTFMKKIGFKIEQAFHVNAGKTRIYASII